MDLERRTTWIEANQCHLLVALGEVRTALELRASQSPASGPGNVEAPLEVAASAETPAGSGPPALEVLVTRFGLSPFERAVVVLCAGMELNADFARLCAAAQGDPGQLYPTFGLALAALRGAHWSALTPAAPLRRWRLIDVVSQPTAPLTVRPLRIDERILHFLTGIQHLDQRLVGLIEEVAPVEVSVPSYRELARQVATAWASSANPGLLIQLWGGDDLSRREIAALACADLGLRLCAVAAEMLPTSAAERELFVTLWERESALASNALLLEAGAVDSADPRAAALIRLFENIGTPVMLSSRERWQAPHRPTLSFAVGKPSADEQQTLWRTLLGDSATPLNGRVEAMTAQFDLTPRAIRASVGHALASRAQGPALDEHLWEAGRAQGRSRLDELARRIESAPAWNDLVLAESATALLREITAHVAHRSKVYRDWGFGVPGGRGLGLSVLFAGASGTGKTLAAEVLAHTLRLDLYAIDLSCIVSKYIGETEKNLRRVFDAAENGGAILFFDEADALFGKRSEVKDSHDRYANIEINYLLQRMEAYRGLAILATNRKGDLDSAFLRRIRFVVNFPYPDAAQRAAIWRIVFPPNTPTEGLDIDALARLNLTGGNIRNIALNAAFLAADSDGVIRMAHLQRAVRTEYAKLEKPLAGKEIGDWE